MGDDSIQHAFSSTSAGALLQLLGGSFPTPDGAGATDPSEFIATFELRLKDALTAAGSDPVKIAALSGRALLQQALTLTPPAAAPTPSITPPTTPLKTTAPSPPVAITNSSDAAPAQAAPIAPAAVTLAPAAAATDAAGGCS